MRILILGGDGMLGHQLLRSWHEQHEVLVTLRRELADYATFGLFNKNNSIGGVDVRDARTQKQILSDFRPDAVVNAAGIIKQRAESQEAIPSIEINALAPHRISLLAKQFGVRLVHISTDCVFSGAKGMYSEDDLEDARDLYGRSKLLGEVHDAHAVTLRTSIIGLELVRKAGLIEWFLAQRGRIKGYRRAIFSGLTTMEMARVIERVLTGCPGLSGLWHVAATPISKYALLCALAEKLGRKDIRIESDESFACNRSLDAARFAKATGYRPPSWHDMLEELAVQIQQREEAGH